MSSHFIRNDNVSPTRFDLDLDLSHSNLTRFFFFCVSQIENKAENIWPISHMRGGSNDLRLHNNYSWSDMINMLSHPIAIFSSWFYFFRKKKNWTLLRVNAKRNTCSWHRVFIWKYVSKNAKTPLTVISSVRSSLSCHCQNLR